MHLPFFHFFLFILLLLHPLTVIVLCGLRTTFNCGIVNNAWPNVASLLSKREEEKRLKSRFQRLSVGGYERLYCGQKKKFPHEVKNTRLEC